MARPAARFPTELEFAILKILWSGGELPVRDVRSQLAEQGRELAHTTVVTTLNTMVKKKYLKRRLDGKAYLFRTRVAQEDLSRGMLSDVVDRVFDGSAVALMLNLLGSEHVTEEEHRELRRLINRKTKGGER